MSYVEKCGLECKGGGRSIALRDPVRFTSNLLLECEDFALDDLANRTALKTLPRLDERRGWVGL